jgi:hypothetical protein
MRLVRPLGGNSKSKIGIDQDVLAQMRLAGLPAWPKAPRQGAPVQPFIT